MLDNRRRLLRLGIVPLAVGALVGLPLSAANAAPVTHRPQTLAPEVKHTGKAPTGYTVTFRIKAPDAKRIRIKGEWSFASAADIAKDPTNPNADTGNTWEPGDFPLSTPNAGSAANWPVEDLKLDRKSGIWSYTTALPSGVFNYQFYADCDAAAPALTGCTPIADPSNPPWNTSGSAELSSQVYVPSDSRFGTENLSWQAPVGKHDKQGSLKHITYDAPGHTAPADKNYLTVYTPPGYNARRSASYPTFYLIHGGGGNEMDWSTQGDLKNIMDNLIDSGRATPMVVVMPNNPTTDDLLDNVVPYVQKHYNVSAKASERAFAGLSGGTTTVQDVLWNDTTKFGYYAVWSAPRGLPVNGEEKNPALKKLLGLHVGVAKQDLGGAAQANTTAEEALLTSAGVPFRQYNVNGGHNWSYWRGALRDFVTKVAFPLHHQH